ncbi:MAG: hypothetical protein ACREQB_10605 [Candidatus Binataceae bacterium]
MGTGFQVWTAQHTWFWLVVNPHRSGGTIGAAATEVDAVLAARSLIEDIAARRRTAAPALRVGAPAFQLLDSNCPVVISWESSLANLERYLTVACGPAA